METIRIYLSPQVPANEQDRLFYEFTDDTISVRFKHATDMFDFSDLPDGELQLYGEDGEELIETNLPINPILSAKKENGVLYVELLNYIGATASEAESFPLWIDHTEYKRPEKR